MNWKYIRNYATLGLITLSMGCAKADYQILQKQRNTPIEPTYSYLRTEKELKKITKKDFLEDKVSFLIR